MQLCANDDAPLRYTVTMTENEGVFFMIEHRENPYPRPVRPGRRRPRRRNRSWVHPVLWLAAAGMVVGLAMVCRMAAGLLWDSMEEGLDKLLPGAPVLSIVESTSPDREPPVLSGIRDVTVYQGDTIAYRSGVSAADDLDEVPQITVDSSGVDLSRPGVYEVIYTASDAAGNTARERASVTVLEKLEGYADLDTIYAAADEKLAQIIRENATREQMVQDIYIWARGNIIYGGHSDRADWRQTAYGMLNGDRGDCYGFFAVTKLLFERLEIPNIDVVKVKNFPEDSDHFWSLLSLDGGNTWYHFDATPRYGEGDDFCLVTDAFLDAYSDAHKGSHNRDRALYPETP